MTDVHDPNVWVPKTQFTGKGDTLEEVVDAYSLFLEVCARDQHTAFLKRLKSDPDAAKAEAAVFSWLRASRFDPTLNETVGHGGIDYDCSPRNYSPFLLEVTSLNQKAVTDKSTLADTLDEAARSFKMITPQLNRKGKHKARQLGTGQAGVPRILAICLAHRDAAAMLSTLAAEWLMVSDPKIQVPITEQRNEPEQAQFVSDLKYAVFFGPIDGVIAPMRQSISAILLVALWDRQLEIVGLLHPEPAAPLDYRVFKKVPFLRVEWPLKNPVSMDWVIGDPGAQVEHHLKINLTEDELRGN